MPSFEDDTTVWITTSLQNHGIISLILSCCCAMKASWALADLCRPPNDYVLLQMPRYCRSHINIAAAKFIMCSLYSSWHPLKACCSPRKASANVCRYWPLNHSLELSATKFTWIKTPLFHLNFESIQIWPKYFGKGWFTWIQDSNDFIFMISFNACHPWNGRKKEKCTILTRVMIYPGASPQKNWARGQRRGIWRMK